MAIEHVPRGPSQLSGVYIKPLQIIYFLVCLHIIKYVILSGGIFMCMGFLQIKYVHQSFIVIFGCAFSGGFLIVSKNKSQIQEKQNMSCSKHEF